MLHVFTIQSLARKGIIGEEFWDEQTIKRSQLNPGLHVSVYSLLGRSVQKKLRLRNGNRSVGGPYHTTTSTAAALVTGTGTGQNSACTDVKPSVPDILGRYQTDMTSPSGSHPPELRFFLLICITSFLM